MSRKKSAFEERSAVVRITKESYEKAKSFKGAKPFTVFFTEIMHTLEMLSESKPIYIVKDKNFKELNTARGEAIRHAATINAPKIELPYIAVILGQDDGKV